MQNTPLDPRPPTWLQDNTIPLRSKQLALTTITGEKNRLANNFALQRSIRHRFPYIDPLHHLQVELIRRYRTGQVDERLQRGIHISINGIAAGLRNTG